MKKHFLIVFMVTALALSTVGCTSFLPIRGSGRIIEEKREINGVTSIDLTLGNLHIEQGDTEELRIEAEDNLVPRIETQMQGKRLEISSKNPYLLIPRKPINFYLTVKELGEIRILGDAEANVLDLRADDLSVSISGSGAVFFDDLEADLVEAEISGSGVLDIANLDADEIRSNISGSGKTRITKGRANEQSIDISGSGKYNADNLKSREADVQISGSGNVSLRVSDRLKINMSGSGNVRYIGNPDVTEDISGSGHVEKIRD